MSKQEKIWEEIEKNKTYLDNLVLRGRDRFTDLYNQYTSIISRFCDLKIKSLSGSDQARLLIDVNTELVAFKRTFLEEILSASRYLESNRHEPIWPDFGTISFEDLTITVLDEDTIEIVWKQLKETRTYADLGFASKKNSAEKIKEWYTLISFGANQGELPKGGNDKKAVQGLRKILRSLFRNDEDPFLPYFHQEGGQRMKKYKTKFSISTGERIRKRLSELSWIEETRRYIDDESLSNDLNEVPEQLKRLGL